jgi:hypothetical protein
MEDFAYVQMRYLIQDFKHRLAKTIADVGHYSGVVRPDAIHTIKDLTQIFDLVDELDRKYPERKRMVY